MDYWLVNAYGIVVVIMARTIKLCFKLEVGEHCHSYGQLSEIRV